MHPQNRKMEQVRDVAQSVEYTSGGREVARSNRVIPTRLQGSPLQPFLIFPPPSSLLSFPSCSSPSSFLSFLIPRPVFPSRPSMAALCSAPCPRGGRPLFPSVFRGGRVWPPHLRPASRCCLSSSLVPCPRPRPFLAAQSPHLAQKLPNIALF